MNHHLEEDIMGKLLKSAIITVALGYLTGVLIQRRLGREGTAPRISR